MSLSRDIESFEMVQGRSDGGIDGREREAWWLGMAKNDATGNKMARQMSDKLWNDPFNYCSGQNCYL